MFDLPHMLSLTPHTCARFDTGAMLGMVKTVFGVRPLSPTLKGICTRDMPGLEFQCAQVLSSAFLLGEGSVCHNGHCGGRILTGCLRAVLDLLFVGVMTMCGNPFLTSLHLTCSNRQCAGLGFFGLDN